MVGAWDIASEPYLLVSADGPEFHTSGTPECRLGHEIPRSGDGQPDGVYGGWSWDGATVHVECDRYGMYPLYYFSSSNRFAISPSIPALLALDPPRDLDESALAVFLRMGFFVGEDTPFTAIRALPPSATIAWRAGQLQVSGQLPEWREQSLGRDAAMDGYIDLFRAAMARRVRPDEDVAVPLSGGRDSRHILLELSRVGRRPRLCVTMRHFPPAPNEDAAVAGLVADRVSVPHVILPQVGSWIQAEIRKNRLTNFCADEHAWLLPVAGYLRGRVRSIYDGIGGDVLSAGLFLTAERLQWFETGRYEELAVHLLRRTEGRTLELVAPEWADRLGFDRAVARFASELARHAGAPNPVGSFYFWNRTRREIALASYRILNGSMEVLSPYLDYDLVDFLSSLPASLMLNREFHSDTIRRAYPEFADLRYENPGARQQWSRVHFGRRAGEVAAWALRSRSARPGVRLAHGSRILSRALRGMALGNTGSFDWRMTVFAVYLLQLSKEMGGPGS